MEQNWIIYYIVLVFVLVAGIGYYALPPLLHNDRSEEHYIGVNVSRNNGTCKITWLGGWDYESFYTNVTVNGENIGHPAAYDVIYNGPCQNFTVSARDKSVHTDVPIYMHIEEI